MKILLIHQADYLTVNKVNIWKKKRHGLGEFYQLSLIEDFSTILNKDKLQNYNYLERQITKAVEMYKVEHIVFLFEHEAIIK